MNCIKDEVMSDELPPQQVYDIDEEEEEEEVNQHFRFHLHRRFYKLWLMRKAQVIADELPPQQLNDINDKEKEVSQRFIFHLDRPLHKWSLIPDSKLIFIIRTASKNEPSPASSKLLRSLRLWIPYTGVFVKANETRMRILQKLRPCVNYGHPPLQTIRLLIHIMGAIKLGNRITRLADNPALIEQAFGKYNIFTIEDIVNEIANVGSHFNDVSKAIFPIPLDNLQRRRKSKKDRKNAANLEELIGEMMISRPVFAKCP